MREPAASISMPRAVEYREQPVESDSTGARGFQRNREGAMFAVSPFVRTAPRALASAALVMGLITANPQRAQTQEKPRVFVVIDKYQIDGESLDEDGKRTLDPKRKK